MQASQQETAGYDLDIDIPSDATPANTGVIPPKSFNGRKVKTAYYAITKINDA